MCELCEEGELTQGVGVNKFWGQIINVDNLCLKYKSSLFAIVATWERRENGIY